jgi:hypothetical protein
MRGAPGSGGIIATVLITDSYAGVKICHPDVTLDFISPWACSHRRLAEKLCVSSLGDAATTQSILECAISIF